MATVTGTMQDFGLTAMTSRMPEISFIPSGPAIDGGFVRPSRTVKVTPAADGTFTVSLAATANMHPARWYEVRLTWLDAGGNYTGQDDLPWRVYVPPGGGLLSDLINAPWNPTLAWYGPSDPPDDPPGVAVPNTLALNSLTGTLSIWSN